MSFWVVFWISEENREKPVKNSIRFRFNWAFRSGEMITGFTS